VLRTSAKTELNNRMHDLAVTCKIVGLPSMYMMHILAAAYKCNAHKTALYSCTGGFCTTSLLGPNSMYFLQPSLGAASAPVCTISMTRVGAAALLEAKFDNAFVLLLLLLCRGCPRAFRLASAAISSGVLIVTFRPLLCKFTCKPAPISIPM
jgi:hypothetical protein